MKARRRFVVAAALVMGACEGADDREDDSGTLLPDAATEGEAQDEVKNRALADFEWSGRIRKVYEKMGTVTVGDLLAKTEKDLLKSKNLGVTSIKEIRKKLAQLGVAMRLE